MGEIPNLVKIAVSLKIQPNDGPVYFKVDGQRFGQNRTIKLLTGAKYKIEVVLKPGAVRANYLTSGVKILKTHAQYAADVMATKGGLTRMESMIGILIEDLQHNAGIERTMNLGGIIIPLEEKSRDPQMAAYTAFYDTEGVTHTKSGERQPLQVIIQFEDIGSFETVWQVKFYNYHKRDHCQWGNSFSSIEYECKPNETRSLMWINKEMFH